MAKGIHKEEVSTIEKGINLDCDPLTQPKGTRRFTLNAVEEASDGQHNFISNELGNKKIANKPPHFHFIGDKYIEDGEIFCILSNPVEGIDEIGLISKDDVYTPVVTTGVLGLKVNNQCDIIYRLRRGNERVFYWVDGENRARTFNLDRPHNFYNNTYRDYLAAGGLPQNYVGEKWDASSFDLIKTYTSIPTFDDVQQIENGNILPGSYNFAIQLVDEDLNPTGWITTSNTTNVYNDSTTNPFGKIRGSRNVTSDSQSFPRTNKSIRLTLGNLDQSFPYYRVAIIRAAGNTGEPDKVLLSDIQSTTESIFIYNGNDSALRDGSLAEILIGSESIFAPRHIEQLENRLILAHGKGKGLNWCDFQKYASKIKADLTTKNVLLNNIQSEGNVKNAKSYFMYGGYMPGEVASYGIVYIGTDWESPVYHIPGKPVNDNISKMKHYSITSKYLDIHNCSGRDYWGVDYMGSSLVGKPVRHHRFPFRKDVNKPLVSSTGTVTNTLRYRLRLNITLNPNYTPSPNTYPIGSDNLPLVIPYTFNYQITNVPNSNNFNGQLVDTDIGNTTIVLYDGLDQLTLVNGRYANLAQSSLSTYQTVGNERFIITETYDNYILSSSFNDDQAEIFGIEFGNIEKPHPDCIGFYIVKNEKTDDDKLIVDNAIFGAMTEFNQYKSFGLLMPKQYYTANNCGEVADSGKTIKYYDKGAWFFNPEFQYLQKKSEFDSIEVEGVYTETSVNMPSTCNAGKSKGVYIDDVQAGTSYNPDINKRKDKDDDGFDLLIGYRNTNLSYTSNSSIQFPTKKRVLHLNAANYQNLDSSTFYNVSVDNKIGMYLSDAALDTGMFYDTVTGKNKLVYGSMVKNNTTAYANFMNRTYFKEHNNPILFGTSARMNNIKIFNGDARISSMSMVSSVFYDMVVGDRAKKSKIWKIVLGAVLVVGGILLAAGTFGTGLALSAAAISSLSISAISYGISMAVAGLKFESMKSMIDTDYEKGLKETVVDGGVFETIRDTIERDDDTIRWFGDRVSNVYIESAVPFGLRSGLTSGITDFMDAPLGYDEEAFRSYLTEKLTTIDRDQGSGRIYKGYASAEVYDMNKDYMRFNKQKEFIHLPLEYDCCTEDKDVYPTRVWWSEPSFQEEKTDNYRVFLPNNYRDIEGEHGEITDLYRLGNNIFIHTKEGLWQLPQNNQERVTNEIVSFIGTGEFFSIMPRKIVDDNMGSGGCQHKWATKKTKYGVFFIDENEHIPYLHGQKVQDISEGMRNWFAENLKGNLSEQVYRKLKVPLTNENNPANPYGVGYISVFDTRFNRIILTKKDYLLLPDKLALLMVAPTRPLSGYDFVYSLDDGKFYRGPSNIELNDPEYFEDKSFTISYSFHTGRWVGWHSYLPVYYIQGKGSFYSTYFRGNDIFKHNIEGLFTTYNNVHYPFIVETVRSTFEDTITEDMTIVTTARRWDADKKQYVLERLITFDGMEAYNGEQCTGSLILNPKQIGDARKWYRQQTVNRPGIINISREEGNWNINEFRNNVVDATKPFYTSKWSDIKGNYYIDKIIDTSAVSFAKQWQQKESLRGKYMIVRLKFSTFDNVNLTMNYSIESQQISIP